MPPDDTRVSGVHCRVRLVAPGVVELEDLGSINGTFVNGQPVRTATVRVGDQVALGTLPWDPLAALAAFDDRDAWSPVPVPRSSARWLPFAAPVVVLLLLFAFVGRGVGLDDAPSEVVTSGAPLDLEVHDDARSYRMVSELWDGRELDRTVARMRVDDRAPDVLEASLTSWQMTTDAGEPLAVSLVGSEPSIRVARVGGMNRTSPYAGVMDELLAAGPAPLRPSTLPLRDQDGRTLDEIAVRWTADTLAIGGQDWLVVSMESTPAQVSPHETVELLGRWVWAQDRTRAVSADMAMRVTVKGDVVWSRVAYQSLDEALLDARLASDLSGRLATPSGSGLGDRERVRLLLGSRFAMLDASLGAEGERNPALLAVLAAIHIADSAVMLGRNIYHDLERRQEDPSYPFNPFDGDKESILEKYAYRPLAAKGVGLGQMLGVVDDSDAETYTLFLGKALHFAGGLAFSLGANLGAQTVASGSHAAHVLWGQSAHMTGAAQQAVIELGRLAWYGSRHLDTALKVYKAVSDVTEVIDAMELATDAVEIVRDELQDRAPARAPAPTSDRPLLLVLDRSGSMDKKSGGVERMARAREAVELATQLVSDGTPIGLISFSDDARVEVPPAAGAGDRVLRAVRRLRPKGGTSFRAAFDEVGRVLDDRGGVVLLITDGESDKGVRASTLDALRRSDTQVNGLGVGDATKEAQLCGLASSMHGWCVSVSDRGLRSALASAVQSASGYSVVADVQDVIRPGEEQTMQLALPAGASRVRVTGTWAGSDVGFALERGGQTWSTHGASSGARSLGSASEAWRSLEVDASAGALVVRASGVDVPAAGELYRMTVATDVSSSPGLVPLPDQVGAGRSTEVGLQGCSSGGQATLYTPGGSSVHEMRSSGSGCTASLTAPSEAGVYPVRLSSGGRAYWTALRVGSEADVVASRARWRAGSLAWGGGRGGSYLPLFVVGLALGGLVLYGIGHARPTRVPSLLVELPGDAPRRVPLSTRRALRLGRDPASDVVLSHPSASREHVWVQLHQGAVWLTNYAPASATMLDGVPVAPEVAVRLAVGARVRLAGGAYLSVVT